MQIGDNIIKTQTKISWNEEIKTAINELLGNDKIKQYAN